MKLYITTPSPFARKVRIVAREKGLSERVEEIAVDPYANAPELLETNPIVQVPTLVAQDGRPITDSSDTVEAPERLTMRCAWPMRDAMSVKKGETSAGMPRSA